MYVCLLWILLPIGIFLGFAMLTFVVTFREKRHVWELAPQTPPAPPRTPSSQGPRPVEPPPSPYQLSNPNEPTAPADELPLQPFAAQKCHELDALGYVYLGSFRHVKGGIYKIRYDAWLSADRYVLAFVEAGKMAAVSVSNLTLVSLGADEPARYARGGEPLPGREVREPSHCLVSITNEGAFEASLTGRVKTMLFRTARTSDQIYWHYQRFAAFTPQAFSEDPIDDYRRFRVRDAQRANELERLRFVDVQETVWLPTIGGGLLMYFAMYGFMLLRRVYPDRWRLPKPAA